MGFADYLKNRQSQFEQNKAGSEESTNKYDNDNRIWKVGMGKDGTGYAVVRFLPGLDPNKTSYSKLYKHAFKGPTGKWYIENCLSTLGKDDPVNEYNKGLWDTGIKENQEIVSKQARKLEYFANILVLKDPAQPSNEGKVFIYKFGKKIFEKIQAAQNPKFADDPAFDPFDMIEGANFRIKVSQTKQGPNYDASEFEAQGAITDDMAKLEAVFNAQHDVHELVGPDKFKSYDELKKLLNRALGINAGGVAGGLKEPEAQPERAAPRQASSNEDLKAAFTKRAPAPEAEEREEAPAPKAVVQKPAAPAADEDDLEAYFKSLAK